MKGSSHGKPFQKGHDPRRHELTREELSRGYHNAVESISRRHFPLLEGEGERLAKRFLRFKLQRRVDHE